MTRRLLIYGLQSQETWVKKTYQRIKGQDVITDPKTLKSNRSVQMPQFLCDEIQEYIKSIYGIGEKDRLFQVSKTALHYTMRKGAKDAGVKRISLYISNFNLCFIARL